MFSIKKALKNILNELQESEWVLAGSNSNTGTVTVPDTATEVMVVVSISGSTTMSGSIARDRIVNGRWELGGYYISANDWGMTNINVSNSNRTFQIRNCRYGGQDLKSSAYIYVYYKSRPVRTA